MQKVQKLQKGVGLGYFLHFLHFLHPSRALDSPTTVGTAGPLLGWCAS